MCGIFCTIAKAESSSYEKCFEACHDNLKRRGPDALGSISLNLENCLNGFFSASVLWTQGRLCPTKQPLVDLEGNILLWNGDILGGELINGDECDSSILLSRLQKGDILNTLTTVQGPYSFIYLDRKNLNLWFGRDPVGKHSFLFSVSENFALFTSVGTSSISHLKELPAVGIFKLNLQADCFSHDITLYPWEHRKFDISRITEEFNISVAETPVMHCVLQNYTSPHCSERLDRCFEFLEDSNLTSQDRLKFFSNNSYFKSNVDSFIAILRKSVQVRVSTQPPLCSKCIKTSSDCAHAKTAVLFSGGLDSTVLALICNEFVPKNEPIDLFNVAFEKISRPQNTKQRSKKDSSNPEDSLTVIEKNFNVPDRLSGLNSFKELCNLCPARKWNFVEINISRNELNQFREDRILDLIYPLNTVLDDSLGCALWFAASGHGFLNGSAYHSSARVLILGMGADELLGGYTRHRNTFFRSGWKALNEELNTEVWNISLRNLGRDNRVTSDHGRQPRFPFLDENVIAFLTQLPPWDRCWFPNTQQGVGDKLLLRLVAWKLGLRSASVLPKRALQFGSRIADSKEKGNVKCSRLTT